MIWDHKFGGEKSIKVFIFLAKWGRESDNLDVSERQVYIYLSYVLDGTERDTFNEVPTSHDKDDVGVEFITEVLKYYCTYLSLRQRYESKYLHLETRDSVKMKTRGLTKCIFQNS